MISSYVYKNKIFKTVILSLGLEINGMLYAFQIMHANDYPVFFRMIINKER
jgi:hypothetical protein